MQQLSLICFYNGCFGCGHFLKRKLINNFPFFPWGLNIFLLFVTWVCVKDMYETQMVFLHF